MNSIGEYVFIGLHGNPDPPKEAVEILERPGVDGVGVWRLGRWGKSFLMRSAVDVASMAAAATLFDRYRDLIGQDPVSLIQDNVDSAARGWLVVVEDVRQERCHAVMNSTGGINPPSLAWLVAGWRLRAIWTGEVE